LYSSKEIITFAPHSHRKGNNLINHKKFSMNIAPEEKKKAFKEFGKSEFDSGSAEAQVALLRKRSNTSPNT